MAITDPRDISGLKLWLSADAITPQTDDTGLSTWSDLSGSGNHATGGGGSSNPRYRTTGGPSGGPRVQWNAAGHQFTILNTFLGAATEAEYAVSLAEASAADSNRWMRITQSPNDPNCFYTHNDGNVYDNFCSTVRKTVGAPGVTVTNWHRYNAYSAPSDWAAYVNGTLKFSTATNTVSIPTSGNVIIGNDGSGAYSGSMACVLIWNRKLTTGERADVNTWLAANPGGGTTSGGPAAARSPIARSFRPAVMRASNR